MFLSTLIFATTTGRPGTGGRINAAHEGAREHHAGVLIKVLDEVDFIEHSNVLLNVQEMFFFVFFVMD